MSRQIDGDLHRGIARASAQMPRNLHQEVAAGGGRQRRGGALPSA